MALSTKLNLNVSQSLVMTPQLMQSIKLLQMTAIELEQYVDRELEKNPLLERAEAQDQHGFDSADEVMDVGEAGNLADDIAYPSAHQQASDLTPNIPDNNELSDIYDASLENIYPDETHAGLQVDALSTPQWREPTIGGVPFEAADMGQNLAEKPTLRTMVNEQIVFAFSDNQKRLVAYDLADQLDEMGYFEGDLQETAQRLDVDEASLDEIFAKLQSLDPPGLFATSLKHCLALQLKRKNRLDPAMECLLENLAALARRDFAYLSRQCGVDQSDLVDMLEEIRALDPKPGLAFHNDTADLVVPDVLIRTLADGTFHVELNNEVLPRLAVNRNYSAKVCATAQERGFVGECLANANWLLKALDQRAQTLLKVTGEIVRHQSAFLQHGMAFLKPLNLVMVAEAVGMHASTISRVTANKYVATPRGTFEMRVFFSAAIQNAAGGESHAADAVRHRIRQLIEEEDVDNVLSDDALVALLAKKNIDIARRTVAKYRESLHISSSVARRREKKARAGATKS